MVAATVLAPAAHTKGAAIAESDRELERRVDAARDISNLHRRTTALRKIAKSLVDEGHLEEAMEVVNEIDAKPRLSYFRQRRAGDLARVKVIREFARRYKPETEAERTECVRRAVDAAMQIRNAEKRRKCLRSIAETLNDRASSLDIT